MVTKNVNFGQVQAYGMPVFILLDLAFLHLISSSLFLIQIEGLWNLALYKSVGADFFFVVKICHL